MEVLREQAKLATALGRWACGCPSVNLAVPDEVPAATLLPDGPLPVERVARAVPAPLEIILFVAAGRLSYLELVYYGDTPTAWPSTEIITLKGQLFDDDHGFAPATTDGASRGAFR